MISEVLPDFSQVDFSGMRLPMVVIYEHPIDFPHHYVGRIWECLPNALPTNIMVVDATLDGLREKIPPQMVCLARAPDDEPHILEAWF